MSTRHHLLMHMLRLRQVVKKSSQKTQARRSSIKVRAVHPALLWARPLRFPGLMRLALHMAGCGQP